MLVLRPGTWDIVPVFGNGHEALGMRRVGYRGQTTARVVALFYILVDGKTMQTPCRYRIMFEHRSIGLKWVSTLVTVLVTPISYQRTSWRRKLRPIASGLNRVSLQRGQGGASQ